MLRRVKPSSSDSPLLLFVYDARRGNTESSEKEKILAFFPAVVNIDEQLSTVGLAQTFALFTGTFAGDSNFITLDTDKRKWAVCNFETGIWVGVVVLNDWGPGKAGSGGCKVFLENLYGHFVLLHGSVQRLLDFDATGRRARASLQAVVEIWGNALTQKKSEERSRFENPLALGRFGAIPTMTVPRAAFLSLQAFVQGLHAVDVGCAVGYVMICHDRFLLWSELNGKSTRQLYNFAEKNEMLNDGKKLQRGATMIYLAEDEVLTPFWLVTLYKAPLTVFLVLDSSPQRTIEFEELDRRVKNDAADLIKAATLQLVTAKDYHIAGYRYANVDRLMHVGYTSPANKVKTLSDKTLQLLMQIQRRVDDQCLALEDGGDFESFIKTENGAWIVTKKAGTKVLYVALDILEDFAVDEVDEYVNRMTHKHFPGCFEL